MATEHDLRPDLSDPPMERLLQAGRGRGRRLSPPSSRTRPSSPRDTTHIPVGESPHSVALSPDATRLYVTDFKGDSVSVVDLGREEVVDTIAVGAGPYGVAVSPAGERQHVAVPDHIEHGVLEKVDLADGSVLSSGFSRSPYGVAAGPDGQRVYLALGLEDAVWVTDQFAKADFATFSGIDFPVGVAVNPQGTRLYVTGYFSDLVSVIDLDSGAVAGTIRVDPGPYGVAVNHDDTRLYVAHFPFDSVSVIDLGRGEVVDTIPVDGAPRGVAVSPDENMSSDWLAM